MLKEIIPVFFFDRHYKIYGTKMTFSAIEYGNLLEESAAGKKPDKIVKNCLSVLRDAGVTTDIAARVGLTLLWQTPPYLVAQLKISDEDEQRGGEPSAFDYQPIPNNLQEKIIYSFQKHGIPVSTTHEGINKNS